MILIGAVKRVDRTSCYAARLRVAIVNRPSRTAGHVWQLEEPLLATISSFCAFPCGHWQCNRLNLLQEMMRSAVHAGTGVNSQQRFHVVRAKCVHCLAAGLHACGSGTSGQRLFRDESAIMHKPLLAAFRNPCFAVSQPPAAQARSFNGTCPKNARALVMDGAIGACAAPSTDFLDLIAKIILCMCSTIHFSSSRRSPIPFWQVTP